MSDLTVKVGTRTRLLRKNRTNLALLRAIKELDKEGARSLDGKSVAARATNILGKQVTSETATELLNRLFMPANVEEANAMADELESELGS
jgi:hypothetical protein